MLVALDVETGGLDPTKHSLLSVGMYDGKREFYRQIRWESYCITPEAMAINGLDLKLGEPWERVRDDIRLWLGGVDNTALGFNIGSFDLQFLKFNGLDYFHYRSIDLNSCAAVLGCYENWKKDFWASFVTSYPGYEQHHALSDARFNWFCWERFCLR